MKKITSILLLLSLLLSCTPIIDTTPTEEEHLVVVIPQDEPEPDIEPTYYLIAFVTNNTESIADKSILSGTSLIESQVPTLSKLEYNFAGWFLDELFEVVFNFSTIITSDITLYAKWTEKVYYTIDFYDFGTLVNSFVVEENTEYTIVEPINYQQKVLYHENETPYTTYWNFNNTNYSVGDSLQVTSDIDFNINRQLDPIHYFDIATEYSIQPWTGSFTYYRTDLFGYTAGTCQFFASWNDERTAMLPLSYWIGDPSNTFRQKASYILLISTNLTGDFDTFMEGAVQPVDEGYIGTDMSITGTAENFEVRFDNIKETFNLQDGVNYRAFLTTGVVIWDDAHEIYETKVLYESSLFEQNAFYTFNLNGPIIANHY